MVGWGAYVRASGSGAGCGRHWPLCNGQAFPSMGRAATVIEYAHRVSSGIALLLVVGLVILTWRNLPPGHWGRRAAAAAMFFMLMEAAVGAGLVLLRLVENDASALRAGYLATHLANTFCLLGAIALTAWWYRPAPVRLLHIPPRYRILLLGGLLATLCVGMSGAITALGDTLFPATSLTAGLSQDLAPTAHFLIRLRAIHPALAVTSGVAWMVIVWLVARERQSNRVQVGARAIMGLVLLQFAVGVSNLVLLAPVGLQLIHLSLADGLWISQLLFVAAAWEYH